MSERAGALRRSLAPVAVVAVFASAIASCRQTGSQVDDCRMQAGGITMPAIHAIVHATDPLSDRWVVSRGLVDEVKAGFEFTVYRGSEYVATLVIDEVREHESIGYVKPRMLRLAIRDGDECATRL